MDFIINATDFLWNYLLIFLLLGTGIYFTILLNFVQIRYFFTGLKSIFAENTSKNELSPFQSLMTAVASQVGTGNIAGVATAIVAGGPGAVFYIWLSSFFGMATIFVEASLAKHFKKPHLSGPLSYINSAFKKPFSNILSLIFAFLAMFVMGFLGSIIQSNSVSEALCYALEINPISIGIALAILSFFSFLGGINNVARICEKIVPFMAILYITGCVFIIFLNKNQLFSAFTSIFENAFTHDAILGGISGITVKEAVRFGLSRGLFSNEAGMGTTSHIHALACAKHPCNQGIVAIFCVFIDTFVVLTLTSLVILTSFPDFSSILMTSATGAKLAEHTFAINLGNIGIIFFAICIFFFGFTTIISWFHFGKYNFSYIFSKKLNFLYTPLILCSIVLGSVLKVDLIWHLSDLFAGLMIIPNVLALFAHRSEILRLEQEFRKK